MENILEQYESDGDSDRSSVAKSQELKEERRNSGDSDLDDKDIQIAKAIEENLLNSLNSDSDAGGGDRNDDDADSDRDRQSISMSFDEDIIFPGPRRDSEQEQKERDRIKRKELKSKRELEEEEREKMQYETIDLSSLHVTLF